MLGKLMDNYKHRCLLPFHHIAIRPDNQVFPCCQFRWEHTPRDLNLSYPDVFNHPFMQQLRESMIKDEYVEGCSSCYKHERLSNGKESMRLNYIKRLGSKIPEEPVLTHVDLALSNVCNNKCRMCNPGLSTSWYSDAIKLGKEFFGNQGENISGVKYSKHFYEQYDLSKLRYIKLIGGEPLMEEDKFIDLLNRCNLSQLRVFLTTNTTLIPSDKLHDLLKKCELVTVNLSVDAYGNLNGFLRKGSQWENVTKVMDWFAANFPFVTKVHGIITIYNVNNFYELSNFIRNRYTSKIGIEWRMVDGRDWIKCFNLPEEVKTKIITNLKHKVDVTTYNMIYDEMMKTGNFNSFLNVDNKLNSIRSEHWKDLNPELYEMVKQHVE